MNIDYQRRIENFRQAMKNWQVDLLFLPPGSEWHYLTGAPIPEYHFELKAPGDWVSGLWVFLDRDPLITITDISAPFIANKTWITDICQVPLLTNPDEQFQKIFSQFAGTKKTIAIAKTTWSEAFWNFQRMFPKASFIIASSDMLDRIRQVKDEAEIEVMKQAAAITDQALERTYAACSLQMTLRDVVVEVEYQMRKAGAGGVAFTPNVVAPLVGEMAAMHHPDQPLRPGLTLAFDIGVRYQYYCSDFGRTLFVGEPSPLMLSCYASLVKASTGLAGILGDGKMTCMEACRYVIDSIASDGYGQYHAHPGLGHGIGLDAHESPFVFPMVNDRIVKGMCLAIEPKILVPEQFYLRIEDVVWVRDTQAEFLTRYTYEPQVIS
jgi:Xaa-Pro dipeptidase